MKEIQEYAIVERFGECSVVFQTCLVVLSRHHDAMTKRENNYLVDIYEELLPYASNNSQLFHWLAKQGNAKLATLMESYGHQELPKVIRRLSRLNTYKVKPTTLAIHGSDLAKQAMAFLKTDNLVEAIRYFRLAATVAHKEGYVKASQWLNEKANSLTPPITLVEQTKKPSESVSQVKKTWDGTITSLLKRRKPRQDKLAELISGSIQNERKPNLDTVHTYEYQVTNKRNKKLKLRTIKHSGNIEHVATLLKEKTNAKRIGVWKKVDDRVVMTYYL